jgi:hypothetical protein
MRRMRSGARLASVLVTLAMASCKDDPASEPAGVVTDEAARFVDQLCALYEPCCSAGASSVDECRTELTERARSHAFDPQRGATCLDDVRAKASLATFCTEPPAGAARSAAFKNPKLAEPGAPCTTSSECASDPGGEGLFALH